MEYQAFIRHIPKTVTFLSSLCAMSWRSVPEAQPEAVIIEAAEREGLSQRRAETLLRRATATGKAFKWHFGGHRPAKYATMEQPLIDVGPSKSERKKYKKRE